MANPLNRSHVRIAWVVAVVVDGLQLITAPAEWTGPVVWVVEGEQERLSKYWATPLEVIDEDLLGDPSHHEEDV